MQLGLGLANAMAHHAACKSNEMILSLNFHVCGIHVTVGGSEPRFRLREQTGTNGPTVQDALPTLWLLCFDFDV